MHFLQHWHMFAGVYDGTVPRHVSLLSGIFWSHHCSLLPWQTSSELAMTRLLSLDPLMKC